MRNSQKGNIFIGLIATIIIFTMIYFLFVPQVQQRFKKQEIPSPLANQLSERTNIPVPPLQKEKYDGALSWTTRVDITENPFNTEAGDIGSSFKFTERKKVQPNINDDLKEPPLKVEEKTNIFDETPTGYAFPAHSDYLDGYPYNHDNGSLLLTIDNTENKTDLIIYLFRISDISSKDIKKPQFSRAIFVKHKEKMIVDDLISGVYTLRWLELNSGKASEYPAFDLYKDNKYQYNRYFKFNEAVNANFKKIPLTAFYTK